MTPEEQLAAASAQTRATLAQVASATPAQLHRAVESGPVGAGQVARLNGEPPKACVHVAENWPMAAMFYTWMTPTALICLDCPVPERPTNCIGCNKLGPMNLVLAGLGPVTMTMYLCEMCTIMEISG